MLSRSGKERALRAAVLGLIGVLVAGCSHLHWPWHHAPPAPPAPVHEVDIAGAGLEGAPQYWKRNTLLIDMSAARGSGSFTVKPIEGTTWPVRVALRVTPGAIDALEVSGAQRLRLPITTSGAVPIDLELPPGVITAKTPQLSVRFGSPPP